MRKLFLSLVFLSALLSIHANPGIKGIVIDQTTRKALDYAHVVLYDGDHIVVHKQNTARNGDLVVALVDDSATVKTFYKEKGHFRLQPENDTMEPIIVNEVEILGTVAGLYRRY